MLARPARISWQDDVDHGLVAQRYEATIRSFQGALKSRFSEDPWGQCTKLLVLVVVCALFDSEALQQRRRAVGGASTLRV